MTIKTFTTFPQALAFLLAERKQGAMTFYAPTGGDIPGAPSLPVTHRVIVIAQDSSDTSPKLHP